MELLKNYGSANIASGPLSKLPEDRGFVKHIRSNWEQRRLAICTSREFCKERGRGSRHGPGRATIPKPSCNVRRYWISPVCIHALSTTYSTSIDPPSAYHSQTTLPLSTDLRSLRVHKLASAPICLYSPERKELE